MGRLSETLEEIPVAAHDDRRAPKGFRRKQAKAELSRQNLLRRLQASLEADYAENASEYATSNIGFDYVVSLDAAYAGNVSVMTRLFSRAGGSGDIYYGCQIRRIADDGYLLWGDEDE